MYFFANNEPIDERDAIDRMAEELGLELPDVPATEDDLDGDLAMIGWYLSYDLSQADESTGDPWAVPSPVSSGDPT